MFEIFIPGNVPSSKNSKVWTGKHLVWSKAAQKYKKESKMYWERGKIFASIEAEYPIQVHFLFIRGTHHRFDYVNPLQTVLDLMVEFEWIPDDNADIILPVFEPYEYNKENPGVYIFIPDK